MGRFACSVEISCRRVVVMGSPLRFVRSAQQRASLWIKKEVGVLEAMLQWSGVPCCSDAAACNPGSDYCTQLEKQEIRELVNPRGALNAIGSESLKQ